MTRDEMIQILQGGGSVTFQGRLIARVEDLPGDDELAGSTSARAQIASLNKHIAELTKERDRLLALAGEEKPAGGAEKQARGAKP